jgi:amino acid transporter
MDTERQTGRQMGVWAATAVVTGEAISLGIFLTPAGMARSLGSPALLGAVWCGMALMTLAGALCFTELAIRFPQAGGEYVYLRHGFGRRVAFLYGWMAAVVMYPGVAAALCVGLVPYVQSLVYLPGWLAVSLPALILISLGALNYAGTRLSSAGRLGARFRTRHPGQPHTAHPAPHGFRPTHGRRCRSSHKRLLLFRRLVGGRQDRRRSS